jgi:Flp pilus assembly protein TadG
MKPGNRNFRAAAKGQAMFLIILALPAIVGALTLVIDVGNLYYNKVWMQTAMDSGALAGALYLPSDPSQAESVAQEYAILNGIKASEISSVTVAPDNDSITMTAVRSLPCYFCVVLGKGSGTRSPTTLRAGATALVEPVRSASGVVPIGVDYQTTYTYGTQMQLKAGQVGPGNWGALALGGTGASNYETNVENGYSGLISIGDMVETEPGNVVGPSQTAIQYRISMGQNQYSTGTFQNHDLNDPRVMLIPMMDFANANGQSQVQVMGFAVVWVDSVDSQGNITCYFIQQSVPNAKPDRSLSSGGVTTPALIG